MFRSHLDLRLLPHLSASPSIGSIKTACGNSDVSPDTPGVPRFVARYRLLVHSQSVPAFSLVSEHNDLTDALGYGARRILDYGETDSLYEKISKSTPASPQRNRAAGGKSPGSPRNLLKALLHSSPGSKAENTLPAPLKPQELPELQYLVSYNMVNNFYYNLVSWSPARNSILIAIDSRAFWWNGSSQVHGMLLVPGSTSHICCVACSSPGHFAVALANGDLSIYSSGSPARAVTRRFPAAIHCVEWFPKGDFFAAGDAAGGVYLVSYDAVELTVVSHMRAFSQQVCGMLVVRIKIGEFPLHSNLSILGSPHSPMLLAHTNSRDLA